MRHTVDPMYLDAFVRLLTRPDPKDLPLRTHVLRYAGDPNRRTTRLPLIQMAWLQQRCLEIDVEEPLASTIGKSRHHGITNDAIEVEA